MMRKLFILITIFLATAAYSQNTPTDYKLNGKSLAKVKDATPTSNSIIDILLVEDTVWLGTSRGLSKSTDEGANWTNYYKTKPFGDHNITAVAEYEGVMWVGTANSIEQNGESLPNGTGLKFSTDYGKNWTAMPQTTDAPDDSSIAYGINQLRALPVTTTVNNLIYDIAFTKSTIWIATFAGGLRKSNIDSLIANPERKWNRVVLPPDSLDTIKPTDTLNFSLQPVAGNFGNESYLNHRLFSLVATDDSTIYAGSANGINKTTDNGKSWTKFNHQNQDEPISGNFVVALNYDDVQDVVWAATWKAEDINESYGVSFSENGGDTWQTTLTGERAHNFGFLNENIANNKVHTLVPTDNGFFRSIDGHSWVSPSSIYDYENLYKIVNAEFYSAAGMDENIIWLGSNRQGLAKLVETQGIWEGEWVIKLASPSIQNPSESYAFPNPFSPSMEETRIKYKMPTQSRDVSIRIFDFDMNLVRTLVQNASREKDKEYVEYWNGKDDDGRVVSNGVYFYRIDIGSNEPVYGKIMVLN